MPDAAPGSATVIALPQRPANPVIEQGRGSVTLVAPGAAGPARAGAKSMQAIRAEAKTLAQRLDGAAARLRARATFAGIQQGRPQQEVLRHSAFARMRAKLDSLPVIEQAKGIIMAQRRCGPDESFDLLRRASQHINVPVRELAAQIVATTMGGPAEPGNKRMTIPAARLRAR